jgi:hypothetical protein
MREDGCAQPHGLVDRSLSDCERREPAREVIRCERSMMIG